MAEFTSIQSGLGSNSALNSPVSLPTSLEERDIPGEEMTPEANGERPFSGLVLPRLFIRLHVAERRIMSSSDRSILRHRARQLLTRHYL